MILISPFSKALRDGKLNPKNYPYWKETIKLLKGEDIVQVGIKGEDKLVKDFRVGLPLVELKNLIGQCSVWVSVDNFFPHLAHHVGKPGVVIWGQSDPLIFGYPENTNLLKDRKYLRKFQFDMWEAIQHDKNVFVGPDRVVAEIKNFVI